MDDPLDLLEADHRVEVGEQFVEGSGWLIGRGLGRGGRGGLARGRCPTSAVRRYAGQPGNARPARSRRRSEPRDRGEGRRGPDDGHTRRGRPGRHGVADPRGRPGGVRGLQLTGRRSGRVGGHPDRRLTQRRCSRGDFGESHGILAGLGGTGGEQLREQGRGRDAVLAAPRSRVEERGVERIKALGWSVEGARPVGSGLRRDLGDGRREVQGLAPDGRLRQPSRDPDSHEGIDRLAQRTHDRGVTFRQGAGGGCRAGRAT